MKTNQQNTKKEKPMQKSKADRTANGKKQHSGKTALRAKKESILTWTALPAKYYSADDRVRFVVKTAERKLGILDVSLPDAYASDPNWCTLTLIDCDDPSCVRLSATEFEMPQDLREHLVRAGIQANLEAVWTRLLEAIQPFSLASFIRLSRNGIPDNDPRRLWVLIRDIEEMPWIDPEKDETTANLRRLLRISRQLPDHRRDVWGRK